MRQSTDENRAGAGRGAPGGRGRAVSLLASVAAAVLLLGYVIGRFVTVDIGVGAFDRAVNRWFVAQRSPDLTAVMRTLTHAGSTVFVVVVTVALGLAIFLHTRRWKWPAFIAGTIAGSFSLDNLVKFIVDRPRPDFGRITSVTGASFPSGHSAVSISLALVVAAAVASRITNRRVRAAVVVTAVLAGCLVGVSRVYLGAHWATDVAGGLGLGALWTGAMARVTGVVRRHPVEIEQT